MKHVVSVVCALLLIVAVSHAVHPLKKRFTLMEEKSTVQVGNKKFEDVLTHIMAKEPVDWAADSVVLALKAEFDTPSTNAPTFAGKLKTAFANNDIDPTAAAAIKTWVDGLKTYFGAATKPYPRLLVRGAGPVGLSVALYSRKEGLQTIKVINNFHRFNRQHIVRTFTTMDLPFGGGSSDKVTVSGLENLLKHVGLTPLSTSAPSSGPPPTPLTPQDALNKQFWWQAQAKNTQRQIQINSIENLLCLVGHIVGIQFEFTGTKPTDTTHRKERAEIRDAALTGLDLTDPTKDPKITFSPPSTPPSTTTPPTTTPPTTTGGTPTGGTPTTPSPTTTPPTTTGGSGGSPPPTPPSKTAESPDFTSDQLSNFDVFVGAEGANSATRRSSNFKPVGTETIDFVTPKCFTTGTGSPGQISNHLRNVGGLVTAGYVVKGSCASLEVPDPKNMPASVVSAKGFQRSFYAKAVKSPAWCQLELYFEPRSGQVFRAPLGWGFNFNLHGRSISTAAEGGNPSDAEVTEKRLKYMYLLLERMFADPTTGKVSREGRAKAIKIFNAVTEFKFYENRLRMSVKASEKDTSKTPYVATIKDTTSGPQLFALVGDALREALPDTGAGVNDGHHTAQVFVQSTIRPLAALTKTQTDFAAAAKTAMGHYQTTLGPHEAKLVCALQYNMAGKGRNENNFFSTPSPQITADTTLIPGFKFVASTKSIDYN